MTTYEGQFIGHNLRIAIVVSRWNDIITQRLLEGAIDTLSRHGVQTTDVDTAWVPGSFELPVVAKKFAQSNRYDAVIALGCVIRGSTSHYDHVTSGVTFRDCTSRHPDWDSVHLRGRHYRVDRTGNRTCWEQNGEQRFRSRSRSHRNGNIAEADSQLNNTTLHSATRPYICHVHTKRLRCTWCFVWLIRISHRIPGRRHV